MRTSQMNDAEFLAFLMTHSVSGAKGDSTVQSAEKSQSQFVGVLQNAFAQSFGTSQGVLNFLNGKLTSMVNNPAGFSPTTKAALTTNAVQQTATDVNNAKIAANDATAVRGGNNLPSGVQAQVEGEIAASGANEESSALNQINLADEQQRQQNYWAAVNGLNGVASAENPTGFASTANSGNGVIAGLSEANTAAENAGPLINSWAASVLGSVRDSEKASAAAASPILFRRVMAKEGHAMSLTPIEKVLEPFIPELRAIAQALRDSQTAPCAACGAATKCEHFKHPYFFCDACFSSGAVSRQEREARAAVERGEILPPNVIAADPWGGNSAV